MAEVIEMQFDTSASSTPDQDKPSDTPRRRWHRWESERLSHVERLWQKVDKRNGSLPEWCPEYGADWSWLGSLGSRGYGQMAAENTGDHPIRVHVFAYELASGEPIPDGMEVGHTCDNKLCVRNDEPGVYWIVDHLVPRWGHLFLATHQDNLLDMEQKGRRRGPPKVARRTTPVSSPKWTGTRRLSDDQIAELIRREAGGESQHKIAADLGVSQSYVSAVARGARRNGPGAPRGERHGGSKLSDDQVAEAIARCKAGETQKSVASALGVTQGTISMLVTGRRRHHVP